jgi:FkbM family methyltransferase
MPEIGISLFFDKIDCTRLTRTSYSNRVKGFAMNINIAGYANKVLRSLVGLEIHRTDQTQQNWERWLRSLEIKTILDIGANQGQFALKALKIFGNITIHSFEPLNDCYEELLLLCERYPSLHAHHIAIGDNNEQSNIYRSSFAPSSSLLKMDERHKTLFPHSSGITEERINVSRLDDAVVDLELTPNILLKMDVQGYEDRVIKGGMNTFMLAKAVISEVNFDRLYKNQADFDTVHRLLHDLGFMFGGLFNVNFDKSTGCPIFADAFYSRK